MQIPGTQLIPSDFRKLEGAWITPEIANRALLRRVDSIEGACVVGRKGAGDYAGIIFPYVWPGEQRIREYRLRLDHPPMEAKADGGFREQHKYLSPPGARSLLYIVPGTAPELLSDSTLPVAITEGEKKTLALDRLAFHDADRPRFLPVGLSGVWNWRGRIGKVTGSDGERRDEKGPIPDLGRLNWASRKTYLVFDSNVQSNSSVSAARDALARYLSGLGAAVRYVSIPEIANVNGIDDWLAAEGAERVLEAFDAATAAILPTTVLDDFQNSDRGLYGKHGDVDVWISSRLDVVAMTRNPENEDWGRLLRWWDADGREHGWNMPFSLLAGDGTEFRARLMSGGLNLSTKRTARELLQTYVRNSRPTLRVRLVDRVGWHDGRFVLPQETIGPQEGDDFRFESASGLKHAFQTAGSLSEWTQEVGKLCIGNSRLAFSIACAFTAPLLSLVEESGGGFHLRGGSSTGKTTALEVAASVWGRTGRDGYVRSWRSTANGLEAMAEMHNDSFLPLDELGQLDARQAGDCAYLLANGISKNRMGRSGTAKRVPTWVLLFLSTGEARLSDHMRTAGNSSRGGQEVRMCEIDADAHSGLGLFETLHGEPNGHSFAERLRTATRRYYGTPIRFFLSHVTQHLDDVAEFVRDQRRKFMQSVSRLTESGEVARAASRFALVAAAGELVTALGITGWEPGESMRAAITCFRSWLKERGTTGAWDVEQAIRKIRLTLQVDSSRFQDLRNATERIIKRLGFKGTDEYGETEYIIPPRVLTDEILPGVNVKPVLQKLRDQGFLKTEAGHLRVKRDLPEFTRGSRVYCIKAAILGEDDETSGEGGETGEEL